jgi:hypothetical protein
MPINTVDVKSGLLYWLVLLYSDRLTELPERGFRGG